MPSSNWHVAVAATLGILEHFPMRATTRPAESTSTAVATVMGIHLIAEARRLAYADRDQYR